MHWLDPDYLPEISGTFERFLPNLQGDADGMILTDGTEVHFPPHLSGQMCAAIRPGAQPKVTIRGVRARHSELIAAVAIEVADGERILDEGPKKLREGKEKAAKHVRAPKHRPMHAEGIVRCILHGPKGEVRGVLLKDETSIRFPPHEAERIAHLLSPGQKLAARGPGLESTLGTVIDAHELGASLDDLQHLKRKKPKDEQHGTHHTHHSRPESPHT
jgi:hypothetical protein